MEIVHDSVIEEDREENKEMFPERVKAVLCSW